MTCYQIKSGLSIDVWLSYLYVWVVEYCEIYVGDDYGFGKLVLLSGHVKRVSARNMVMRMVKMSRYSVWRDIFLSARASSDLDMAEL